MSDLVDNSSSGTSLGLPGTYIRLECKKGGSTLYQVMAPYSSKVGFRCSQKWWNPIKELFEGTQALLAGTAKTAADSVFPSLGGMLVGGAKAVSSMARIFGLNLFNKGYLSQAWEGEEPLQFSFEIDLFMGRFGIWQALAEVYAPTIHFMEMTVPSTSSAKDIVLHSPGPTGLDVYMNYSNTMLSVAKDALSAMMGSNTVIDVGADVTNERGGKYWTVSFGYSGDGINMDHPFFKLENLIMLNSEFSFSTNLDSYGCPISSKISGTLSASSLVVSTDFSDQKMLTMLVARAPTANLTQAGYSYVKEISSNIGGVTNKVEWERQNPDIPYVPQ